MQTTLALLLTLLAGANACSTYHKCHCTNADGSSADAITATVCNNSNESAPKSPGWPVYSEVEDGVTKCILNESPTGATPLDNCKFRDFCTAAGATGADSSCEVNWNTKRSEKVVFTA